MAKKPTNGQIRVEERYAAFVAEYLISGNSTKAAIKAGYSAKTAGSQGSRLLNNVKISAAIENGRREIHQTAAKKLEVTSERVIKELARIGFSDLRKAIKWKTVDRPHKDGKKTISRRELDFELVDSDMLDDDTAAAIAEVTMTARGPRMKFYDKRAALVDLGKVTGVFADGVDVTVPVSFVIEKGGK